MENALDHKQFLALDQQCFAVGFAPFIAGHSCPGSVGANCRFRLFLQDQRLGLRHNVIELAKGVGPAKNGAVFQAGRSVCMFDRIKIQQPTPAD